MFSHCLLVLMTLAVFVSRRIDKKTNVYLHVYACCERDPSREIQNALSFSTGTNKNYNRSSPNDIGVHKSGGGQRDGLGRFKKNVYLFFISIFNAYLKYFYYFFIVASTHV